MSLLRLRTRPSDVQKIDERVQEWVENGRYASSVRGMMIGTSCDKPYLVNVPVDLGISNYHSVDDLNVRPYMWMTNEPEFKSFIRNREHVDRFPLNARSALDHPFTFFFEEDTTPAGSNKLIRKLGTPYETDTVDTMRGNVIVLKHTNNGNIDNIGMEDWPLVKVILEWLVGHRGLYINTCPHGLTKAQTNVYSRPALHEDYSLPVDSRSSPQTYPIHLLHQILRIRDLRLTFFENTGVLTLFALGATCSTMRTWVQAFYRGRVTRLLSNVFPVPRHIEFFDVLHSHHSRIGGSFAYAVVDPSSVFIPNNINILSPFGKGDSFCDILLDRWGCTLVTDGPTREPVSSDFFEPRTIYMKTPQGYSITITESDDFSLMSLMLTGYTTAECVLLGGHTFTLLYPSLVENREVLRLPSVERAIPEQVLDCVSTRFNLLDSTQHLGRPCGESCPNIWRRSLGMKGSATLYWGGFKNGRDSRLKSGSYEWKIAHTCRNPLCKWSSIKPMEMCDWLWWAVPDA
ncbi:hypothetical protein F5878DRAFT_666856 [Lentinula raphanica]|uniref:Uncharacterized protein n=1 Tax=Lentinula raphanica TaxID=153919 RepID=A0AA38NWV6_9AGAR|nr:hypothetical protein F5878DRAFT_666856 [Lentinula raphanica]